MKVLEFIQSKTFLKYSLILLSFMLAGMFITYKSYRHDIPLPVKKKDNSKEIKKLIDKADILLDENNRPLAILTFNKAIKLCDPKTNAEDYIYSLYCIADSYYSSSDFISSEIAATKALPYLKFAKNPRFSWFIYNIQGLNYLSTYNFNEAEIYFKKALNLKTSLWRKRVALNNIAAVYQNNNEYKKALEIYKILALNVRASNDKNVDYSNYSFILDNMGYCYYRIGDYNEAIKCYNKGLEIRLNLGKRSEGLVNSYRHLSIYFEKRNSVLAKKYGVEAVKTAAKMKSAQETILSLNVLIRCSEGNDLKKYSKKHIHLVDSIVKAEKINKNQFSIIKYESKADKEENLKLKAEKAENELSLQRHKNQNLISYIIITFISGFLLLLLLYFFIKIKKERKEAVFQSEMRISNKLHNELTKDVHDTLLFAQNKDLENNENKNQLLTSLDKIYSQTRNISRENSSIVTNENYDLGLKEMLSGFKTSHLNILINGLNDIDWIKIEKHKKIIIYRILQEILVNMKKNSNPTLAGISFKIIKKDIFINYTDNGKGADITKVSKSGLQIIENRILSIKGKIQFESNPDSGFKISIKIPV